MAGAGYKLFNTGDVLTAAQVNTYLQEQAVMRFANSTARTTALSGVLAEGMVSYLDDTNAVEVYNGSAWVGMGSSGDITAVTAGTGISGGGTSGDVTITNSMATAIDAKGDLIVGTAADAFARLPVGGTNGHVLTVDSAQSTGMKWAAVASGGGKVLQVVQATTTTATTVTGTTFADTGLSASITPSLSTSKVLVIVTQSFNSYKQGGNYGGAKILRGATTIYDGDSGGKAQFIGNTNDRLIITTSLMYLDSPATTSATTYKTQVANESATGTITCQNGGSIPGIMILMEIGA